MKKKLAGGIVYSTNPDFVFNGDSLIEPETPLPGKQVLRIWLDSKNRKGKTVTLVKGFVGLQKDLEMLARDLKIFCGTGGSVRDQEIIIQGNVRDKITDYLKARGYKVIKAG